MHKYSQLLEPISILSQGFKSIDMLSTSSPKCSQKHYKGMEVRLTRIKNQI